jgi:predicted dehydrogenase
VTVAVAVVSAAHSHAHAYADVVADLDGAVLTAVVDDDGDRGRAFADRHGIEYAGETVAVDADAAVVCAENAAHRRWVEAAAAAGLDVLCEKPLATTAADARGCVDACEAAGVALGVAMPMRFSEPVRRAKATLEAGELGDLQAVVGTNLLQRMAADTWFIDPERSGGGAVMDHSVHVVDLVRWLTGEEVAEVYAESGTRFGTYDVEDVDLLSMALTDGTPVTHDGSWRQPDTWEFWGDVTLRLIGTDGVLEVDCFDQTLAETCDGDDPGRDAVFWGTDPNVGLLREFLAAVEADRTPAITGEDGVREVRVVEAAYESVDTGAPVPVEYRH